MTLQPKPEPGLPPDFTSTNPNNNFEQKTIPELVHILRGTYKVETFDTIERVLKKRDTGLREEIQQLQKKFESEKLQILEKLQMEVLSRMQAEEEVRKREELCEKGKRVQESYETLLKEVKVTGLADTKMIKELRKENNELEFEVKNLKQKCVDDGKKIDVIRRKNAELEAEVLELRKMKEKLVEDGNELGVLRKMVGESKNKVLELKKLNEKLVKDNKAVDEIRGKVRVLEDDKKALAAGLKIQIGELEEKVENHLATISELREEYSKLADEKRKVVIVYKLLCTKFRDLQGRVSKLEDDSKHWKNGNASDGGNSEGEPRADHMVADFEDNGRNNEEEPWMNDISDGGNDEGEPHADPATDFEDNGEEDDIVEAAPLSRNEDAPHSLGVVASTHPQNIEGNGGQGASSGEKYLKVYSRKPRNTVKMAGSSRGSGGTREKNSASGRVELLNGIEVINLDDEDDGDDWSISQGVDGNTAILGIVVKDEYPSSSVATQQNSKLTNAAVDTVKRKFPFPDIETSSDDSSSDSSFDDELPISSVVSQGKKTKM